MLVPDPTATVSASYAQAVAAAVSGERPPELLADNGSARLPFAEVRRLWDQALDAGHDPQAGLRLGAGLRPQALHVLGHLLLACGTLGEAADAAVRYHPLVSQAGEITLHRGPTATHVRCRPTPAAGSLHPQQVETIIATMATAARWLAGPTWAPAAVSFTHAPTGELSRYQDVFACPVTFGAAHNDFVIPNADLEHSCAPADPQLAFLQRHYADQLLAELDTPAATPERVRRWLAHSALDQVRPGDLQSALNLSERSVRRALREHGTSWRALLDEARHTRARHLLETTELTTDRIARTLGLSSAAALGHAFTRWQGTSPGAYRRALQKQYREGSSAPRGDREDAGPGLPGYQR